MKRDMKYTIRLLMLLTALIMGAAGEVKAITNADIVFSYDNNKGSANVKTGGIETVTGGTKVTITVTPGTGYFINKSNVVAHKLVDPALAPRRALSLDEPLEVSGPDGPQNEATDYSFVVPNDFKGAQVTITFITKTIASAEVKANDLVYNQQAQALFTVTNVEGGKVKFYKKDGDIYTEIVEATGIGILFEKKENRYEEVDVSAGDPEDLAAGLASGKYVYFYIPKETNANETNSDGTYQQYTYYYYKIIPDNGYSAEDYKQVKVTIKKAKLTGVTLAETAMQHTGSELTFGVSEVKAGELTVPAEGYTVSGNTQTAVGSYQATVTGTGNFEGEVKATFQIVASSVILVTSATQATDITDLNGHYILTVNVSADVFANLYGDTKIFTGTFDGDMYTISGLSHALFNIIDGGTVKNVMLDGVNISEGTNVGAIANEVIGQSDKIACIYNCGVLSGSVSGSGKVGGLVGVLGQIGTTNADKANCFARVINCFSYADIKGGAYKSGIVGYNCFGTSTDNLRSMVMNCMFYGDILNVASGDHVSPIYGGTLISNKDTKGVGNYNYFRAEATYIENQKTGVTYDYNCALMAETRYLQRFEFFRHLLNSHREVAAWWATGNRANKDQIMKWVLEPSQIGSSTPYPILKRPGKYPSVVNIDAEHAVIGKPRNQGGKLGELTVKIQAGSGGAVFGPPSTASITTNRLTLNITDKDTLHYNFNYYKVQLPYYNDVGTGNYRLGSDGGDNTSSRVVTGWKIVDIKGGTPGTFTNTGADVTYDEEGNIATMPFNFADRNCTNKDLYSESGRVFNQGAYWDVPEGVTEITIEPYWARAAYLADQNADKVYTQDMKTGYDVPNVGGGQIYTNGNSYSIAGEDQIVYTSMSTAISSSNSTGLFVGVNTYTHTVYDYAVVLVGNYHHYSNQNMEADKSKPYTVTSVDLDGDNEPDYSYILRFDSRNKIHPVRVDFINIPGLGMAQKSTGGTGSYNFGIMQPLGWFESTNTSLFRVTQFEYDNKDRIAAPYILQGGVMEQWVSGQSGGAANLTTYFHVGGNVWFKEFHRGTHQDQNLTSKHPPVSVTGGDFDEFYLTGLYKAVTTQNDNAECYISGGRFGIVAGTGMEGIGEASKHTNGNITWQISYADIREFYGGGINAKSPVQGNITTIIKGSHVKTFCGGPKFGDMWTGRTVKTTATDCEFGTYFGAGYGGNSFSRQTPYNYNNQMNIEWNKWVKGEIRARNSNTFSGYQREYKKVTSTEEGIFEGVSTQFNYQFLPMSANADNCARLFINYVTFSLAKTKNVTSNLTGCTITGNFYGGGSLGKVEGPVTSTLRGCTVNGSVFGAGFSASLPTVAVDSIGFRTEPYYYTALGSYRKGVKGPTTNYTWDYKATVNSTATAVDNTKHVLYTSENLNTLGTVTGKVTLNIEDGTTIANDVFGGGESSNSTDSVVVNIKGGTMKNVYGGASAADVGKLAVVNLTGGIITNDVFGGGKGRLAVAAVGEEGKPGYIPAVTEVKATVGKTLVNLNGTHYTDNGVEVYPDSCKVLGRIFGCNDINGSPLDTATVHIYKTAGASRTAKKDLDDIVESKHHYHLQAVYGGGNLAAFEPSDENINTATTHVIIDGCDMTSIKQVYGGGNAASTPATFVEVNGTYEIGEVFGGGNGKDPISEGKPNPGANVGYYDYAKRDSNGDVETDENGIALDDPNYDTPAKRQDPTIGKLYGSGMANVRIYGGKIHRVFGGSNTLGNVRNIALTLLDGQEDCDFSVDEAYGGGKSAPMDGAAKLEMACIPGLKAAYGGAEEAEIHNDVTLNITNGTFDRVFGGNNVQGTITGTITVNIEETGCRPIIIGQLYGGGNQAPYEAAEGKTGPTINVRSFTSIGDIFGGGYGKTATVKGDTHVNINVAEGDFVNQDTDEELTGNKTITFQQFQRNDDGTFVYDETNDPGHTTRLTEPKSINLYLPPHAAGEIGGINNVYGGGNEARVEGNTKVSIGTEKYVLINTITEGDDLTNKNYYISSGAGTAESPYEYTKATGTAQANKKYYALVKGANIVGNVYGGGNEAEVTGNTNVTIGKQETTTTTP